LPSGPDDVSQQRAIAHILGTLDDKIELYRRILYSLDESNCVGISRRSLYRLIEKHHLE